MKKAILHIGKPRELMKKVHIALYIVANQYSSPCWWNRKNLCLKLVPVGSLIKDEPSLRSRRLIVIIMWYSKCEDITLVSSRWSKIRKDFYNS